MTETAGSDPTPPLPSDPADLPVVGLHREIAELTTALLPLVRALAELNRNRRTTTEMCWWLDDLKDATGEIEVHAKLLRHMCDVLWEQAYQEGARRRQHHEPSSLPEFERDAEIPGRLLRENGRL